MLCHAGPLLGVIHFCPRGEGRNQLQLLDSILLCGVGEQARRRYLLGHGESGQAVPGSLQIAAHCARQAGKDTATQGKQCIQILNEASQRACRICAIVQGCAGVYLRCGRRQQVKDYCCLTQNQLGLKLIIMYNMLHSINLKLEP